MDIFTHIDIPKSSVQLTHQHKIMLLGSCFADNIGALLRHDKFDVMVNPFGTLYNPASIAVHLWRCISQKEYTPSSPEVFCSQGPVCENTANSGFFFSWLHHSSFSASTEEELCQRIQAAQEAASRRLREADWLIVTFGSSYIYRLKETGMLVANCHKQPDVLFSRTRLPACDIADQWTPLLEMLHSINPRLRVLFTVSPIRHRRDGFHQNQLSKAELLLAIDQILATVNRNPFPSEVNPESRYCVTSYFPSYEILMDELRDYRFYADDMLHPSSLAVDYIYERFADTYINKEEQQLSKQCRDIHVALAHRPIHPEDPSRLQFVEKIIQKIQHIQSLHPYINWDAELELCRIQFKKSQQS